MCVICIKKKGVRLPLFKEVKAMWERNPHGAGFMYARDGKLTISKGYMTLRSLIEGLDDAHISEDEALVIHFRISTQGGINPEMCHPFPVSKQYADMCKLDASPEIAIAHNGIIQRCSEPFAKYSDTALFVTRYVSELIRKPSDIGKYALLEAISALAPNNKFALMDKYGNVQTVGDFEEVDGLLYSNLYHVANYN